jgi:hypothetical protein
MLLFHSLSGALMSLHMLLNYPGMRVPSVPATMLWVEGEGVSMKKSWYTGLNARISCWARGK